MLKISRFTYLFVTFMVLVGMFFTYANINRKSEYLDPFKFNFGLDLQGGIDLVLMVDIDQYLEDSLGNLVISVKSSLKKKRIGYNAVQISKKGVIIELRDPEQKGQLKKYITSDLGGDYKLDTLGKNKFVVSYTRNKINVLRSNVVRQSMEIIRNRIDERGNKEIMLTALSEGKISLQVPGENDPSQYKDILNTTAKMTFRLLDKIQPFLQSADEADGAAISYQSSVLPKYDSEDGSVDQLYYIVEDEVRVSGENLVDARVVVYEANPAVSFTLDSVGSRDFSNTTTHNTNRYLGIVLDGEVISSPIINEPIIGGTGIISGSFSIEEANKLALLLRAGALPAPIKIVEERVVGAALGKSSIQSGKLAMALAIILVMVFMVARYGMLGILADLGILVNISLIIAALSILKSTLTLPGIAGIILTIGMCVDANVLIFERMREGAKKIKKSNILPILDEAFKNSLSAIMDSNITTIFSGLCMYFVGFGPIKGFSVTLVIGVLCSMFSSTVFTRVVVASYISKINKIEKKKQRKESQKVKSK